MKPCTRLQREMKKVPNFKAQQNGKNISSVIPLITIGLVHPRKRPRVADDWLKNRAGDLKQLTRPRYWS